jgi:predicted ester cyclase
MSAPLSSPPVAHAVLDRYYEVLNRRDSGGFATVLTPDVVFDDDALRRAEVRGVDAVGAVFTAIWQALPDLTFTLLAGPFLAADYSSAMVHLRISGTMSQPLEALGRTNVGGLMDLDCMALYEFTDDRISRVRVCCDPAVLDAQLGTDSSQANR